MDNGNGATTAQIIASGSQDFAALAGLFCTDGVERNALAAQFGYGAVVSSSLSILGILGLVKSSIKLALGLERCRKSGFSVDSLRGFFGYDAQELPFAGDQIKCDEIDVRFEPDEVLITKTRRYYDSETRPIVTVGTKYSSGLRGKTALNLGNLVHERSFSQHPLFIATAAFLCTGSTSWILFCIGAKSSWELWFATVGLVHSK